MTFRIGWVSPLTPKSGIGTFSKAVLDRFPSVVDGETIDVTVFYVDHAIVYATSHRAVKIVPSADFRAIFGVFDLLIYNIGNNREHHGPIYDLLQTYPGIVIAHDYVYQHYLADRCVRASRHFAGFAALLRAFSTDAPASYLRRSQITSRDGRVRYSPWDTKLSVEQPMSEVLESLGSGLVVHSSFARRHAEPRFDGPILQLGMPHDIRPTSEIQDRALGEWQRSVHAKSVFDLVSFGHIQSSKCLDLVVEAIGSCEALRRRVRYTIAGFVGDQAFFETLKSQIEALDLAEVVRFEVGVSDRRLEELMVKADAFVNLRDPNTEAASLSLVEQLDAGRPVVVIDSGCYAEVPDDAAVKIPRSSVDAATLAAALHGLVDAPARMVEMGRAGRRHARTWTCQRYAKELVGFALTHRSLLERRGRLVFDATRPQAGPDDGSRWLQNLRRARTALTYLDRGTLHVDPALVAAMSCDELCDYVGDVVLGVFGSPRLRRSLARFFAGLDRQAIYWACRTFSLVADATFGGDEVAASRLMNDKTCLDPEFWGVLEHLPPRQFLTAATLILDKRHPSAKELSECERDDSDGYPTRSRLAALLAPDTDQAGPLRLWAAEVRLPTTQCELPVIEQAQLDVGSATFRSNVDLSGFHGIEADRAWTRGKMGFIGMRLGAGTRCLELQVCALLASADQPCEVGLACGDDAVCIEARDGGETWIRLAVDVDADSAGKLIWFSLSVSRAGTPPDTPDTRVLGVCLRKLLVGMREDLAGTEVSRVRAVTQLAEAAQRMRLAERLDREDALESAG